MRKLSRLCVVACAFFVLPLYGKDPASPPPSTLVDCSKGDSINAALARAEDGSVIEISGMCSENVVIQKNEITLRGTDPLVDGIREATPQDFIGAGAVTITRSGRIVLENLTVTGAKRAGVVSNTTSVVQVRNGRLIDNGRDGFTAGTATGTVIIEDTTMSGNGRAGLTGFSADLVTCVRCTITGPNIGVMSIGSRMWIRDSNVTAYWAVGAEEAADLGLTNGTIDGAIWVNLNAVVVLTNVTQTANPEGANYVEVDSALQAIRGTTLLGETLLFTFGKFMLYGSDPVSGRASSVTGGVLCDSGGDAFCANPANISGTISGCDHCAAPAVASSSSERVSRPERRPRREVPRGLSE